MLLELAKKGFDYLKKVLGKFKIESEEICYIMDQADNVFSEFMENGLYDKIDSICEDDLFDRVVVYSLNSAEYNVDEYISSLLENKQDFLDADRQIILSFFHRIQEIIIEAQIKYGIKNPENKVLSKQIQAIQARLDVVEQNSEKRKASENCLIGILACEIDDPRTRELLELPKKDLLNLNEYVKSLSDLKEIRTHIEKFKNTLSNVITYKIKLACSYSIAYLSGAIFSQKISNLVFINGCNEWHIGEAEKIELKCRTIQRGESDDINVAISIGTASYIDEDVLAFIEKSQKLIAMHYDSHIQTSGQFNAIGDEITKRLKKLARDYRSPINLFYRGPAEIMFLLGQKSNDFGQCSIYEFNFKEKDIQKRTYIKGITF